MRLCRVVGNLVSTCKVPSVEDFKVMVVRPVGADGSSQGGTFLALDCAQAGVGDYVLVNEEGRGAALVMGRDKPACNKTIVGVVDYVDSGGARYRM